MLQLFCGILDRLKILSEVLADARARLKDCPHQCMLGDFNT